MSTSPSFSVNNQRGLSPIFIVLGALLVLALVGGAYYLGTTGNPVSTQPVEIVQTPVPATATAKPSPTAQATATASAAAKTYKDAYYNYSLEYPTNWTLTNNKDAEGNARAYLKKNNATKAAFSTRSLPEIFITVSGPYSTSGGVCFNQSCTEVAPLNLQINGKSLSVPVTKGEVAKNNDQNNLQFDFYAFSLELDYKALSVYASYKTPDEVQEISQILSSLKY